MPYTRNDIENARREMTREGARPPSSLRAIPPEAPYVGDGPLFIWTGSEWLDWNTWIATTAPIRIEPEEK